MKKQLLKNLRLRAVMLVALLCAGISGAWGETVTWSGTVALPGDYTPIGGSPIQIKVSSTNSYTDPIRVYSGTTISIQANNGAVIQSVTYEASATGSYVTYAMEAHVTPQVTPTVSSKNVTWSYGNNSEVTEFTFAPNSQTRCNNIKVTYKIQQSPELSFNPATVTINQGESLPSITFQNPHSVTGITFSSSNNSLATVNNNGEISLTENIHGTTTITATFAGNSTYSAQTTNCVIVVNAPQHTAKFYINGQEQTNAEVQVAEGEAITFPENPGDLYGKTFIGWTTEAIDGETNVAPTTLVQSATMGNADVTYYAVYAIQEVTTGNYLLDYGQETSLQNSKDWGTYGKSYNYTAIDGGLWTIKAYKSNGMQINTGKNSSIKVPNCPGTITSIVITNSGAKAVGFSVTDYNGSGTLTYLVYGTNIQTQTLNLSNENVTTGYIVPKGGSTAITKIVVNYRSVTNSAYCTSFPTATFTLSENCYDLNNGTKTYYGTFSNPSAFVIPEGVTAHTVSVAGGTLTVVDYPEGTIVPANTGVMVSSATAGEKTVVLTSVASTVSTEDNMLRPTGTGITSTQMAAANSGCKFYYLTMNGSQIGFYRRNDTGSAFEMPVANKAYLAVPEGQVGNIKDFSFNDIVDGIKAVETTETESKAIYNLAGQRISKMQKGIYIVNGKKVLVK